MCVCVCACACWYVYIHLESERNISNMIVSIPIKIFTYESHINIYIIYHK